VSFLSKPVPHWTILDAHHFANETAVTIGDWCSGTVIDAKQGLVVTASHCVDKLKHVKSHAGDTYTEYDTVDVGLTKFKDDGTPYSTVVSDAVVIGDDSTTDVAILRVFRPKAFSVGAKISTVVPKFGDHVFTVGHPLMFPTVIGDGYISQPLVNIYIHREDPLSVPAILFTALIDHGSSGGALYNDAGELIGVTNWEGGSREYMASPAANITALLKDIGLKLED